MRWGWWIFVAGLVVILYGAVSATTAPDYDSAVNGWLVVIFGVMILVLAGIVGALSYTWRRAESILQRSPPMYYPVQPSQPMYYSRPPPPITAYGQTATVRTQSCPYCGAPLANATQPQCESCGRLNPWNIAANEPQPPAPSNVKASGMKFCRHCGKRILDDSIYCQHCGKAA